MATYHQWMQDPDILFLTASEPLTLEQEYENQLTWLADPTKYTFILKADGHFIGDVNLFFHAYLEPNEAEIDVMIGDKDFRQKGYAREAVRLMMCFGFKYYSKDTFIAKIKECNLASIKLFTQLGFQELKKVKAFDEVHYTRKVDQAFLDKELAGTHIEIAKI